MTAEELLEVIVAQHIRLMPRFDYVHGKLQPAGWIAARIKLSGQRSYAPIDQFAVGTTPIEAVENLIAGKTEFVRVGGEKDGGYLPAGEVAAREAAEEGP